MFDVLLYSFLQYLKEGLSRIDGSWAASRFDSLPHVVHILTSKDREGEVRFLTEQSDLVEDVVDEVVHVYHHGFNKAIQNYSQVSYQLQLLCIGREISCCVLVEETINIVVLCAYPDSAVV